MNILSLFDGMSCGRVALERVGITVNKYYASEIDKYATIVSNNNYPDIIRLGDVTEWKEWNIDWSSIDMIIAGSPCQGFSFAGKQLAFNDPRSKLFFVFVDILNHVKSINPNVNFLLENVRMKKEYEEVITRILGVEPIMINSSLVSAQNRKRLYWANWSIEQPKDKGILLKDIIEPLVDYSHRKISIDSLNRFRITNTSSWVGTTAREGSIGQRDRVYSTNAKMCALTATIYKQPPQFMHDGEILKLTPIECERLQTLPDNYTNGVSNSQRYKMIGNGWTVDVIAHIFKTLNKGEI